MIGYQKLKNIVYTTTAYEHHTADVYLPEGAEDSPLVIAVHGGAFQAGSKEMYADWGPYLASRGIAVMAVNYTLATPSRPSYPLIISEMDAAINFAVQNAGSWKIDPLKLGFMGDSAGAYLGAMAAFGNERSSAKIKFVVCAYGVMDIVDWAHYTNATRTDFVINKMFGCDPHTGKALYQQASPVCCIHEAVRSPLFDTSFFMIWGKADEIVLPEKQTVAFINLLKKLNIPHETYAVPNVGHFWFTKNDSEPENGMNSILKDDVAPRVAQYITDTTCKVKKTDPNA
ncbi:alpha/beta hydrolase [Oscillospiraceae bacterium MB08-C2-2]|nr:alpha/beta hydrolase [Oscillospiraceae bacterium MB08-C2-2]